MTLVIPGGCGMVETEATPGLRVARWHESYREQSDPIPGTVLRVGKKFLTVEYDNGHIGRVEPQNVTLWSEPKD